MNAKFEIVGSFVPDSLIAGNHHLLVGRKVTIVSGQNLARGAVLGKITTGGKFKLSASAASDGSQSPDLVLAEACDASAGDQTAMAYSRGDFNSVGLVLGAGHTVDSITDGLRQKGIVITKGIA